MKLRPTTLAALAILLMAGSASAVTTVSYSAYTAASQFDTSWVNPVGATSVKRVNFGGGETTYGPNNETWLTGIEGGGGTSYNAAAPILAYYSAPNSAWGQNFTGYYVGGPNLLNQGTWNGGGGVPTALQSPGGVDFRVDLVGFTVGQQYLVQFVLADTRVGANGASVTIDGYSANISSQDSASFQYAYADGRYAVVTASFTPSAGDTDFSFRPLLGGNMQLNALQILTIPEPGTAALGCLGMICLLRRRRA